MSFAVQFFTHGMGAGFFHVLTVCQIKLIPCLDLAESNSFPSVKEKICVAANVPLVLVWYYVFLFALHGHLFPLRPLPLRCTAASPNGSLLSSPSRGAEEQAMKVCDFSARKSWEIVATVRKIWAETKNIIDMPTASGNYSSKTLAHLIDSGNRMN